MTKILGSVFAMVGAVLASVAWSQDLTNITLDDALVFAAPNGEVVNVMPGRYALELAEADGLILVPAEGEPITVQATREPHYSDVAEPVAQLIAGEGERTTHVLLLLPDGDYVATVGSRGGVLSRAANPFELQRQYLISVGAIRVSRMRQPGRTIGTGGSASTNTDLQQDTSGSCVSDTPGGVSATSGCATDANNEPEVPELDSSNIAGLPSGISDTASEASDDVNDLANGSGTNAGSLDSSERR